MRSNDDLAQSIRIADGIRTVNISRRAVTSSVPHIAVHEEAGRRSWRLSVGWPTKTRRTTRPRATRVAVPPGPQVTRQHSPREAAKKIVS
jgi:hypothetical protein